MDDLLKLKLKHLKLVLAGLEIQTNTCKEKRDLAELLYKNRLLLGNPAVTNLNQQQSQSNRTAPSPQPQPHSSFNQTLNNFVNNVQEFVNYNLNSALNPNNAQPAPPPSHESRSNQTFSTPSSTSSNSNSSSMPSNLNNLFNLISDQVPNVLHQTLNNNFSFNNVFTNDENQRGDTNSNSATNRSQGPTTSTSSYSSSSYSTSNDNNLSQPQQAEAAAAPAEPTVKRRASLSDIKNESDIDNLTVKQIKEMLTINFVDYKGCVERRELVDKLKRLFQSHVNNKKLEEELSEPLETEKGPSDAQKKTNVDESDLCKICMETLIDCVLLDCGHMVSCTKCGKRLAECPICRQNVVRVVRVFKS